MSSDTDVAMTAGRAEALGFFALARASLRPGGRLPKANGDTFRVPYTVILMQCAA